MDGRRSSVAKRTRAQARDSFSKMLDEYYEKKQREKSRAINAEEKKREELDSNRAKKRRGKTARIPDDNFDEKGEKTNPKKFSKKRKETDEKGKDDWVDDDEGSGSDIKILRKEEMEDEINPKKLSEKTKEVVEKGKGDWVDDDDEGSGSDVKILREEEMGEEINPKKFSEKTKETSEKGKDDWVDDDEGSGSDIKILRKEEMEDEIYPKKLSEKTKEIVEKGKGDWVDDDDEGSGSDIKILREEEMGEEINPKKFSNKMKETIEKGKDDWVNDDEGSGSDIKLLREEEMGEEINPKKFSEKRKETVEKGKDDWVDNEEGSGSDIKILREEEKGEEFHPKIFNRRGRRKGITNGKRGRSDDGVKILKGEEKGKEINPKRLNKRRRIAVRKGDDDEGRRSEVEILREEEKGKGVNPNTVNKRRETVKMGQKDGYDDVGSASSDVRILRRDEKGEEVNRKKLNIRGRETVEEGKQCRDNDEGSGGDVRLLREEEKEEEVNPKKLNKKGRETNKKSENGCKEGSASDVQILGEEENAEEVNLKKLNKRGRETDKKGQNVCDDDGGSGSDIVILTEESVPPGLSINHVKGWKHFPFRGKRGRSDGNRTNERISSEVSDRGHPGDEVQVKGKNVLIDNDVKGWKHFPFRGKRGRSDGNRTNERISSEVSDRGHPGDEVQVKGKNVLIDNDGGCHSKSSSSEEDNDDSNDEDYNKEESWSSYMQSDTLDYCSEDDLEGGEDKDDGKRSPSQRCIIVEREEYNKNKGVVRKNVVTNERKDSVGGDIVSEEKMRGSEFLLKKREVHGLNQRDDEVVKSRLLRLRPRLRPIPESRKLKLRLGTSRNSPLLVSESDDSDFDSDSDSSDEDSSYDDHAPKHSRKVEKLSQRRASVSRNVDFVNILLDKMLKEDDQLMEKPSPLEENAPTQNALPLKFRFEDEDPAPPEKVEGQKEIDNLFAEMEMCLVLPDPDSTKPSMAGIDDVTASANNPADRCLLGEHQLILEEPTGIICKCCQIVYREMKYIFPALKKETPGRRDWVDFRRDDCLGGDELQFSDSSCGNYYSSIRVKGSVLDLIPTQIRLSMYCHQLDGFVFLWKNIAGETCIDKLETQLSDDGRGCIISHAPGTGKTLLTIVFIMSFLNRYPKCRPVIVAPTSMLLTWEDEFRKWGFKIPFHNYNSKDLSGDEIEIHGDIFDQVGKRLTKLFSWMNQRSVLGISYKMFEQLASGRKQQGSDEKVRKILLEQPGLMVLDEGHTPRNHQSLVWKVLTEVKTRRKIILSGTPFQNNFDELFNTLCLVNPNLSGSITSKNCSAWHRKSNVEKEKWVCLTNAIDKKADNAVEELKAIIDPFVHVHKGTILEESLPGLKDTLVILRPTDQQKDVLQLIPDNWTRFDQVHLVSLISVHPSLAACNNRFSINKDRLEVLGCNPHAGVKTKFAIELIRLCDTLHEKVLVFSEFIHPLKFIMKQLSDQLNWREGKEVLYMDGKRDEKDRQSSISSLNDPSSEVKVLLASTKACSEGINLVGASRVVLLDVVWNPSVERQAISRAYRLGQKKLVYVYHLITFGTLEVEKYAQQANKDRLSELVFSCQDRQSKRSKIPSTIQEDKILEAMLDNKMLNDIFENIIHQPKESNVFANFSFVEHKH